MPPNLFLIILLINIAILHGQITLSNMGDWNELSHAEIVEESRKMCNLLRKNVNETNKWEDNKTGEVPIPVGWHNCLLFNLSSGFRGDKEMLKQPPPSTSLPEGKLAINVEKFQVEHADNFGMMKEISVGKLNVLVHLVLSWEDKRLAQMVKMEHPIQLADLDWIWTPTLTSADYCGYFSDCFSKKVAVFLYPNHRVLAIYTLRFIEQCQMDYSRFPTEVANCERQIILGPTEKDLQFQCQNEKGDGLSEEEHGYFEKKMKIGTHIQAEIENYGMGLLAEAKKSKKWKPEENSIECGPSEEKCTPKEECEKRFGNVMTLKMKIIQERGPMATISLCAIPLLAIMAFFFRRASANTALAFLFVPMFCLFMASFQYPLHGFPNGPPKILKFYNAAFFIASANLLCFLLVQMMKKIDNDIFPFPFPYRWLLLAKFLNELPGKLFKWRPAADERLVDDSAEGHGEDVEIVEMGNGNGPNSAAGNGNGNEAASNLEMWVLLDKMLASILALWFAYIFIWTIG